MAFEQNPLVADLIEVFDPDDTLDFPSQSMNEVYPGLFIGNHGSATDLVRLQQEGITHVLNCALGTASGQCDNDEELYKETGIKFLGISMVDTYMFDIMPYFKQSSDFISAALNSGGRILVHCMFGVSRSASLVLAYLMMEKGMSAVEAARIISEKRAVYPNHGFLSQLCKLQEELDARRKTNSK